MIDLEKLGAGTLLNRYSNSPRELLMDTYPEHEWIVWKFNLLPRRWFESPANARLFFETILHDRGFEKSDLKQLYHITYQDIRDIGGGTLLKNRKSLFGAVSFAFPEHPWDQTRFVRAPMKTWQSHAERRKLFEEMRKKIFGDDAPISSMAGISFADISEHRAASLLAT